MNTKTFLRWCAMPFAAIIGAFVAYAFISLWIRGNNFGFQVYNGEEVGSITQIILAIAAQALFGAAFVYCGAMVAPSNQRTCAVVLSTLISILAIISFIIFLNLHGFVFMQFIHSIATIIGSILVVRQFTEQDKSNHERKATAKVD